MKTWMAVLAAAAAATALAGHAAEPVLTPILVSHPTQGNEFRLELFDPTQPRSPENPFRVESGIVGTSTPITARLIRSARVADGLIQPLDFSWVVYLKSGRIYRRDLRRDANHERLRVSGLEGVCTIRGQVLDLARPVHSWILVRHPGADGGCFSSDDDQRLVRLSMGSGEMGESVGEFPNFAPELDASGAIASFLYAGRDPVAPRLERRNPRLGAPVTIAHLDPADPYVHIRRFGFATTFVIAHVAGAAKRGLYRVEDSGGGPVLSPVLHRFDTSDVRLDDAASDGQYLYFAERNRLLRLPMDATSPAQAHLLFRGPSGRYVTDMALSGKDSPRIIFTVWELATDHRKFYSMQKDGGGAPVLLVNSEPLNGNDIPLLAIGGSRLYFSNSGLQAVHDDGSGTEFVPGHPLVIVPGRLDPDASGSAVVTAEKLLLALPGEEDGFTDYRMYDAVDGEMGCRMGSARTAFDLYAPETVAMGRTFGLAAQRPRDVDYDAYVVDLETCGSLQPSSKRTGPNEYPVWGY